MSYYELILTIELKEEIDHDHMYEYLNFFINKAMLQDPFLKEQHEKNTYKFYVYNLPMPMEEDKIYKTNRIYYFNIRSIDQNFLLRLQRAISFTKESLKVISMQLKTYSKQFISNLTTLTPIIITMQNHEYWISKHGAIELISRVSKNAIRKYNQYYSKQVPEDTEFIESVQQLNRIPIKIPYKTSYLIGNKVSIGIKSDALSQELGFFMKAVGLAEKNTIGAGYSMTK